MTDGKSADLPTAYQSENLQFKSIIASDEPKKEIKDPMSPESQFVADLLINGFAELHPEKDRIRKFYVTLRHVVNPMWEDHQPTKSESFSMHNPVLGATDAYRFDVFEEGTSDTFIPVGHHDFYINHYSDHPDAVAEENLVIPQRHMEKAEPIKTDLFNEAFFHANDLVFGNALDVVGSLAELIQRYYTYDVIDDIQGIIKRSQLPSNLTWQGYGFGKLLVGLKIEILKQLGVDTLDLSKTSLSEGDGEHRGSLPIYRELGYNPVNFNTKLNVKNIPTTTYHPWIAKFLATN